MQNTQKPATASKADLNDAVDDLRKLHGLPPYNHHSNIYAHDLHFQSYLKGKHSPEVYKLALESVKRLSKKYAKNNKELPEMK